MNTQHSFSLCCHAFIRKHGNRRRQCISCLRTWSIYQHKRGRKILRRNYQLMKRIVLNNEHLNLQKHLLCRLTPNCIAKRFNHSLTTFSTKQRHYPQLVGSYILLADGIHHSFAGQDWVTYVLLLKPRRRNTSYILDPITLLGKESFTNWQTAINTIPVSVQNRIYALVSDNFATSTAITKHYGWLHQLCHFHLIAQLQLRRGNQKRCLTNRSVREGIYQIIRRLLVTRKDSEIQPLLHILQTLSNYDICPRKLSMMAHEFIHKINNYRTYLNNPTLTIPYTNNAVESFNNLIRKRTRCINNPESMQQWILSFVRLKKKIACNGQRKPQN